MWILNYVTRNSLPDAQPEKGSVKGVSGGQVQVDASSDFRSASVIAPYGISYVPPVGEKSAVISANGESLCLGTVSENRSLEPGELMLRSAGGATVLLSNDGNVYINGKVLSV